MQFKMLGKRIVVSQKVIDNTCSVVYNTVLYCAARTYQLFSFSRFLSCVRGCRLNSHHIHTILGDVYESHNVMYVIMLCYVMICYVMLCYVMLCYVMLCYVMICYVMICYVMLCCVMLCYVM